MVRKNKIVMRNKLSTDINVDNKWKQLNNVLFYGFLLFYIVRGLIKLKERYSLEKTEWPNILLMIAFVGFLGCALLNILYKIKPIWFNKKEVE